MLKILLVDDDKIIRKGLRRIIEKFDAGYEVIGEAVNGVEALKFMETQVPDLMITDVKMPVMNGTDLCKEVKKRYGQVRMVILSGFDDFQYVREAMKNGVVDYLLKPVDNKAVKELLENITKEVSNSESQKSSAAILKEKIEESNIILNERFLRHLLHTNSDDLTTTVMLPKNSYSENINSYILCMVDRELQGHELQKIYQEKNNFYSFALLQKIYSYIKEKGMINDVMVTDCKDKTVMVWQCKEDVSGNNMQEVLDQLSSMRTYFACNHGIQLICCVTHAYETVEQSREAYKRAKHALERFFYDREDTIIADGETRWNKRDNGELMQLYHQLKSMISSNDKEAIGEALGSFYGRLKEQQIHPEQVRKQTIELLKLLLSEPSYVTENLNDQMDKLSYVIGYMQTNEGICERITLFVQDISDAVSTDSEKGRNVIRQAKKYIKDNYYKEISLKEVAEYVELNPNYFSAIFKHETKKTFMDYLTDVRITEAKKLLEQSTLKIYEVGYEIGYKDTVTFSRAFKRVTGISPKEYRNL